jgi:hypothetical protein
MIRGTHLAGRLCKHVETIEVRAVPERTVTLLSSRRIWILVGFAFCKIGKFVKAQEHALAVTKWNCLAFLDQVVGETVDTTLGELFATGLASVLVSVARVL